MSELDVQPRDIRMPTTAFLAMLYASGYFALRITHVLHHDVYGFFRAPYVGRYHVAPDVDSGFSVVMWHLYIPLHAIEHFFWRMLA